MLVGVERSAIAIKSTVEAWDVLKSARTGLETNNLLFLLGLSYWLAALQPVCATFYLHLQVLNNDIMI